MLTLTLTLTNINKCLQMLVNVNKCQQILSNVMLTIFANVKKS